MRCSARLDSVTNSKAANFLRLFHIWKRGLDRAQTGSESEPLDSRRPLVKKALSAENGEKRMSDAATTARILWRGARMKCPSCGEGRLFKGYLTREDACPQCHESFEGLDADDGPAWLTIGLVAHIVVPLLIFLERGELMPYWREAGILIAVTIVSALFFLPVSKGFFVAALWLINRKPA